MTTEQIKDIINYAILIFGAGGTISITAWRYFLFLEVKAKENSTGERKVKELEGMIEKLQGEIKDLKNDVAHLREKLEELSKEFKELMKHIYSNYLGRK